MKRTRRDFMKVGGLALTGMALMPGIACKRVENEIVTALQLYSVRDDMRADPSGTLKQLAAMGYTHVEHANYVDHKFYGWSAQEFKKVLDDLGILMPSGHTVLRGSHWDDLNKDFTDEWKKLVDDAAFMGQEYVISPSLESGIRNDYDKFISFVEVFNRCGELCKQSGMRFGYHNHAFEFSESLNGEMLFDLIMKNTDPDKVVLQLDMGNMYSAGALAKDVLSKYPGRYDNIHVKDMVQTDSERGFESTVLGEGLIESKEVTDLARGMGSKLFIIEQEAYQGRTPLECMKMNYEVMKEWGYIS